ncbi:GNAT family N-acetyltransferase [Roseomonas sp. OT10]|uniref:GNAT family N-acetyltransferase n=1 Tax=Roseomonas cutis TaxID=2897332 RepID=UPI001E4D8210|nr:GNAT family N-acetyltransferase [Roseomonas sp. OT10]UFN50916.1 GNAT family N-acetyltransferase [Roseomonas sp. OT10]
MISVRRAKPQDAGAIGQVHVAAWRDAYAGLLPDSYLAALSAGRIGAGYQRGLVARRDGEAMFVAETSGPRPVVIGFASAGPARREGLAEGEIETLYVLSDWREQGVGRRLLRAAAAHLAAVGCRSAMLWVLSGNNARFFYRHLGGRLAAQEVIRVGGQEVQQTALTWDPIGTLLSATAVQREG